MLYTIDNVERNTLLESVLESSVFLNENIRIFSTDLIPVISLNENMNLVDSMYITRLASEEGISISEAMEYISFNNTIPTNSLYIAFQEHEIIIDPQLATLVENYVIVPISETSPIYTLCEACVDAFAESGDEIWLELLLEEDHLDLINKVMNDKSMTQAEKLQAVASIRRKADPNEVRKLRYQHYLAPDANRFGNTTKTIVKNTEPESSSASAEPERTRLGSLLHRGKQIVSNVGTTLKNNKGKTALGVAAAGAAAFGAKKYMDNKKEEQRQMEELRRIEEEMARMPKSVIGKKIAALRRIYSNYLEKARAAKEAGQAGIFKKIASAILGVIDKLMARLQKFAG